MRQIRALIEPAQQPSPAVAVLALILQAILLRVLKVEFQCVDVGQKMICIEAFSCRST
jgi:hypothetical protein